MANSANSTTDLTLAFGPTKSASETLHTLWQSSVDLDIDVQDLYGNARPEGGKWLGDFEAKVAKDLGKEQGLFVPSGIMAQHIMLKIAQKTDIVATKKEKTLKCDKNSFYAHPTSHLLRYENDGYAELLGMSAHQVGDPTRPLSADDLDRYKAATDVTSACALILEVPHREIGGQMTSWDDILKMKTYCADNGLWFHMVRVIY